MHITSRMLNIAPEHMKVFIAANGNLPLIFFKSSSDVRNLLGNGTFFY